MTNWLYNLHIGWMALFIFTATYCVAAAVYWIVMRLAVDDRARAFQAVSPGMSARLGIIFGLLVSFIAVEFWSVFDREKVGVSSEASALRSIVLLAENFSRGEEMQLRALVARHIEKCVNEEWPAMGEQRATLTMLPTPLIETMQRVLAHTPANDAQRTARREIVTSLRKGLDPRPQRINVRQSNVGR